MECNYILVCEVVSEGGRKKIDRVERKWRKGVVDMGNRSKSLTLKGGICR